MLELAVVPAFLASTEHAAMAAVLVVTMGLAWGVSLIWGGSSRTPAGTVRVAAMRRGASAAAAAAMVAAKRSAQQQQEPLGLMRQWSILAARIDATIARQREVVRLHETAGEHLAAIGYEIDCLWLDVGRAASVPA